MVKLLDINADLGEGSPNDPLIMPYISSCNIACGSHAGDEDTIRKTIVLAQKHNVKIGAHPSFPDRENFGRKKMNISNDNLQKSIIDQLQLFQKIANSENCTVHHVKTHGALYNEAAKDKGLAQLVIQSIASVFKNIQVFVPPNSELEKASTQFSLQPIPEAFIDRTYENDGSLSSRNIEGALITDPHKAWEQLKRLFLQQEVVTRKQSLFSIEAKTFCIHGDQPNAVKILTYIHDQAQKQNLAID